MANAIRIDTYADRARPIEATLRAAKTSTPRPDFELVYRDGCWYKSAQRPDKDQAADVSPAPHLVEAASRASSFQPAISWIDFAGQSLDQLR
jgi:hypothetical protein